MMQRHDIFFSAAIREALDEEMQRDDSVFLIGEDIGVYGGAFGVTRGLLEKFSDKRVINTPISENSVVGAAIGASLTGLRPVVEIMYMDFILLAMDQIVNKAAKLKFIAGADLKLPLVIRTAAGSGRAYGPDHSQSFEALFMHIPGLIVVYPSTPEDAKALMKASIRHDSPVIFIEHKFLYGIRGSVSANVDKAAKIGKAAVVQEGKDLTIITYGKMLHDCLKALSDPDMKDCSVEVIDLRTLKPLDKDLILSSVSKTGRLLVVEEDNAICGVGSEVITTIVESSRKSSKFQARRLAALDSPIPASSYLESSVFPQVGKIKTTIKEMLKS